MYVIDSHNRVRLAVDGKHLGVEAVVEAGEHAVINRLLPLGDTLELLDAGDARKPHVLGDFDGIGAPGGDHLAARAHETAFY